MTFNKTQQIAYYVHGVRYKCPRCLERSKDKVKVDHPLFIYLCGACAREYDENEKIKERTNV